MLWINKKSEDKTAEDIAEGQIVIITARWILILAGWVLALWEPEQTSAWELRAAIVMLMTYSTLNFFLTIQWVNRGKILAETALMTSMADLGLITALAAVLGADNVYVFYLPALLALSVTFPRSVTAAYTAAVIIAYGLIAADKMGGIDTTADAQTIFIRLFVLAAVAFCGSLYRGLEAERRDRTGRMFQVFRTESLGQADAEDSVRTRREVLEVES